MGPLDKRLLWLAPLILAGVALVLRAAGQAEIFAGGDVAPIGGEAWYHLRRQAYGFFEFPALLGFDPYLRFPRGAVPPWAPGFDTLIGRLALLADEGGRIPAAQRLAAWAPSVAGALCVPAVYAALVRRFGVGAALVGALCLTVLPAHVIATQVGYVSHRAPGALFVTLMFVATLALLRVREPGALRDVGLPLLVGALSAFALWISMSAWWPLAVAHAALFLQALSRSSAAAARASVTRVAIVELATVAGVALFAWPLPHSTVDAFSVWQPSHLHVAVLGVWFAVAAGVALAWRTSLGGSALRRVLSFFALGLVVDGVAIFTVPALWDVALALPAGLIGDASMHAAALEPALRELGSVGEFAASMTAFAPALPLLVALVLVLEWQSEGRAELLATLGFASALAAAAWFAPGGFVLGAIGVALVAGCAAGAIATRAGGGKLALAGVALAALLVLAPALLAARAPASRAQFIELEQGRIDAAVLDDIADWLARDGRPGGKFFDVNKAPIYSVLAPWQFGHRLLYKSHRAPVLDGFYPILAPGRSRMMRDLYRLPAYRAAKLMERFIGRYVIVPDVPGFPSDDVARDSLVTALLEDDGSETVYADGRTGFAVGNLRLVYEHGHRESGGGLRVYENVRGARVVGSSMPDRIMRFSLRLRTDAGREFTYRATTVSDPYWGNYEIRLPYSTRETKRAQFVRAVGPWQIECNDEVVTLEFPDWKARDGAQVTAPGFCY